MDLNGGGHWTSQVGSGSQIKLSTRLTDPKLGFTRKIMGQIWSLIKLAVISEWL